MNVATIETTPEAALEALKAYKSARPKWDKLDMEIARIYRQIAKGNKVIDAIAAIRNGGLDSSGMPRLALMRADQTRCICQRYFNRIIITNEHNSRAAEWHFGIPWKFATETFSWPRATALLPRIPPQYRPDDPSKYHLLWEANWTEAPPTDPYLLKRIGKDAWLVLAAWELTSVEVSVIKAHR